MSDWINWNEAEMVRFRKQYEMGPFGDWSKRIASSNVSDAEFEMIEDTSPNTDSDGSLGVR